MNPENHKTNKLIFEKSPYLLQHATNPVNWYPWCEEAFEKAKIEDKPILLSIGYATCHWCHVMEIESFENESIATFLNLYFVSIKVDREERPDIDKIYMDALHAMDQQGGWPLNMFLTPDKMPIAGGTYFPPEPRYGRKSFLEILNIIKNAWISQKEEILRSGENLLKFLTSLNESEGDRNLLPEVNSFALGFNAYLNYYDPIYHGFKTNAQNKFPPSMAISFLLNYYYHIKNPKALEISEATLIAMKKGGIYDQIGGGLCRYSTDQMWLIPHFEKMLYDNSLYLLVLVECYSVTKNQIFKNYAYDVINYISRDMTLENGGISCAEDADSEGEEGKFYAWDYSEFINIVGEDSNLFTEFWNVTQNGNFDHNKNILNEAFANNFHEIKGIDFEVWNQKLQNTKSKLLGIRSKRIRPLRDDKVLTSWNSLYIRALAMAGRIFEDEELILSSKKTYDFLISNLIVNNRVLRRWREGEAAINGYLVDYVELAHASIELYRATFESKYLIQADSLVQDVIKLFSNEKGAFFDTGNDSEKLIKRSIDCHDNVEPSGNTTMSFVLQKLALYGFSFTVYMKMAEDIFTYFKKDIETRPLSSPYLLSSFLQYTSEKKEIIFLYKEEDDFCSKIKKAIQTSYLSDIAFYYSDEANLEKNKVEIPILIGKRVTNQYVLYICKEGFCEYPIQEKEEILITLRKQFPSIGL